MKQLTVCGVGLIGGSLALAARRQGLAERIVGVDLWPSAPPPGVVDEAVRADDPVGMVRAFEEADLTVLALPVRSIENALPQALAAAARRGGVVTDCGSTKRSIVAVASGHAGRQRFVPGHPMAGHPVGGLAHADPELFVRRRWLLCPEPEPAPDALERVTEFVRALGAEPVLLGAEEHDRSVALTSHVPQLLASALAVLADEQQAHAAAGPGFASTTRVAGGAPSMWRDIFVSNADAVAAALRRLGTELAEVADALEREPPDPETALHLLGRARALRERNG